jgi:hypothetical protein
MPDPQVAEVQLQGLKSLVLSQTGRPGTCTKGLTATLILATVSAVVNAGFKSTMSPTAADTSGAAKTGSDGVIEFVRHGRPDGAFESRVCGGVHGKQAWLVGSRVDAITRRCADAHLFPETAKAYFVTLIAQSGNGQNPRAIGGRSQRPPIVASGSHHHRLA